MKKQNWLVLPLAILLVFGLAFLGCDNGSTTTPGTTPPGGDPVVPGGPRGDPDDESSWYHVLASEKFPYTLVMEDNFQYGEGYQGQIDSAEVFEGEKVLRGGTYWLKATFTVERDLENPLYTGLVDGTEAVDWWGPLTWDGDNEDDDGALVWTTDENGDYTASDDYIIEQDVTITALIKLTALQGATSASLLANKLNFQTEGEGDTGTKGSGVLGEFDIIFTELLLVKDTAYDEAKAAAALDAFEPPPPVYLTFKVDGIEQTAEVFGSSVATVTGIDALVVGGKEDTYTGYQVSGTNYQGNYAWFEVDLGVTTLADYEKITFTAEGIEGDIGYKQMELWVQAAAFTGGGFWSNDAPIVSTNENADRYWQNNGAANLYKNIDATKANTLTGKVYLAIYWPGDGNQTNIYQLSNIELVLGSGTTPPVACDCGGDICACAEKGDCSDASECTTPVPEACDCGGDICGCAEKGDCGDASECTTPVPEACDCGGDICACAEKGDCGDADECTTPDDDDDDDDDDDEECECEDVCTEDDGECECETADECE